jgi:hypothetical protein
MCLVPLAAPATTATTEPRGAIGCIVVSRLTKLDDHFTNRFAAAIGLDKTGRLRQAGKPPQSSGKDVDYAKSICTCDCLGP